MTRSGDASERRRRIRLGYTPGADGTLHSPQPVEPEGRRKRRKASGHKHTEGQPPEDHGADHDAGGADENPHVNATTNPHAVTHSQVGAPSGNPHGVTASETGAVANRVEVPEWRADTRANQPAADTVPAGSRYTVTDESNAEERSNGTSWEPVTDPQAARDPHGNEAHSPGMVVNAGDAPRAQRDTRANQPSAANVGVGSRYIVRDENETEEVAADTTGDGAADTWVPVTDQPHRAADNPHAGSATDPHGDEEHSKSTVANMSATPEQYANTRNMQPGADTVPVGARYWVTDENVLERSNGTSWDALAGSPDATVAYNLAWPSNAPSTVVLGPTSGLVGEGWRVGGVLVGWRDETLAGDQATYTALINGAYAQRDLDPDLTNVHVVELAQSSEAVDTRLVTFDDPNDGVNKVGLEFDGTGDFPADMVFRGEFSGNAEIGTVITNTDRSNVAAFSPNTIGSDRIRMVGRPLAVDSAPSAAEDVTRKNELDGHTGDTANPHSVDYTQTGASADPHDDAAHSRDYDADFANVAGDDMQGSLFYYSGEPHVLRTDSDGNDWSVLFSVYYGNVPTIRVDKNGSLIANIEYHESNDEWQFRDNMEVWGRIAIDADDTGLEHASAGQLVHFGTSTNIYTNLYGGD